MSEMRVTLWMAFLATFALQILSGKTGLCSFIFVRPSLPLCYDFGTIYLLTPRRLIFMLHEWFHCKASAMIYSWGEYRNPPLLLCFLSRHVNYTLTHPGLCSQEEERLVRDLFRGYNKLIRPVQNMTEKVDVAFGLAFIQLINVVSALTTFLLLFKITVTGNSECNLLQEEIKCLYFWQE